MLYYILNLYISGLILSVCHLVGGHFKAAQILASKNDALQTELTLVKAQLVALQCPVVPLKAVEQDNMAIVVLGYVSLITLVIIYLYVGRPGDGSTPSDVLLKEVKAGNFYQHKKCNQILDSMEVFLDKQIQQDDLVQSISACTDRIELKLGDYIADGIMAQGEGLSCVEHAATVISTLPGLT